MTVTEYEREFVRLSKYALECVSTEDITCKRFEDGLNEDVHLFFGVLELKEFVVLVDRACKAEELVKEKRMVEIKSRDSRKRQLGKSFQSSSKKSREFTTRSATSAGFSNRSKGKQYSRSKAQTTSVASVGNARPSRPKCLQCGKCHPGEFRANKKACFKCGSLDHFIRDCPEVGEKEKPQNARSGSPGRGRLQRNLGNEISSKNTPREQTARSEGREPARTYAICAHEEASPLNVIIDEQDKLPVVVSHMSARKYVRKGYEAYLSFVMDAKETELRIESVPIVCEYPDVFPEEFPRLLPVREIEFDIELAPGTVPISIAPYRMAPTELKKLKAQLQELTDIGFARPSYFPWGAPV
ncbi:Gag-Pol polyprotein [Gossypium australe]|uniref:Gag-Pol polyprotein n=1 Tax=Gossypium australe TaxID=47621 RepID=A0A5B6VMR3_9ROSI|nr:Gag-Pol polyprotein [Gossypium australe]